MKPRLRDSRPVAASGVLKPDDSRQFSPLDPLTVIAIRQGTDKWGSHFYTPIYHSLLAPWRGKPVRLLEIGVGGFGSKYLGGASLAMWAEYFERGLIFGIDLYEKRVDLGDRVRILQGSQDDREFLERTIRQHGPFDVIIDDGSHIPAHVATSFHVLFPSLATGGLYIVEDTQTAYWPSHGGAADGAATMSLARDILKGLNHQEIAEVDPAYVVPDHAATIRSLRAYHNLLVFEKGDNTEPSDRAYDIRHPQAAMALESMAAALGASPTPRAVAFFTNFLIAMGRQGEALDLVERHLRLAPMSLDLLVAGFSISASAGLFDRANSYLRRALTLAPDDTWLRSLTNAKL